MDRPVYIRVPGSVGNVGPGFDALGLAVQVYLTVIVEPASDGVWSVSVQGEDAETLPADTSHRVIQMALWIAEQWHVAIPPLRVEILNEIPVQRGLGGSGASVLAGIALAGLFRKRPVSRQDYLEIAVAVEGHADNVAASLRGGLVACYWAPSNRWYVTEARVPRTIRTLVLWPPWQTEADKTSKMRDILPDQYPRDVVVRQLQRVATILAFWQRYDRVPPRDFFMDEMHQPHRLDRMPEVQGLLDMAWDQDLVAILSGAGPAVVIFATDTASVRTFLERLAREEVYRTWRWRYVRPDRLGLIVRPLTPVQRRKLAEHVFQVRSVGEEPGTLAG